MMNTLAMIKNLNQNHGMKAESVDWGIEVTCEHGDLIVTKYDNPEMIGKPLPLTNLIINTATWEIVKEKILFAQAVNRVVSGNVVTCLLEVDGEFTAEQYYNLDGIVSFDEIYNGQWFNGSYTISDFKL